MIAGKQEFFFLLIESSSVFIFIARNVSSMYLWTRFSAKEIWPGGSVVVVLVWAVTELYSFGVRFWIRNAKSPSSSAVPVPPSSPRV